jgi:mRNA-degrading endonuclease RelE of RelBE toxin-antitoxin system
MALVISRKVTKEIRGIPKEDWEGLKERLERIARDPQGLHPNVERLTEGGYRVRQGDWRAIYDIAPNGNVEVIKVGHRREVYRQP